MTQRARHRRAGAALRPGRDTHRYDVIVVGAGASGAPLAVRLSENPARKVLLVEAGPDCPTTADFPPELLDAASLAGAAPGHPNNWAFAAELTADVPYTVPRGRILGGSTSLNGTYFVRARAEDFARWVELGNTEWSFDQVLPYYRKLERDLTYGDTEVHGGNGPLPVSRPVADPHPLTSAFGAACAELGFVTEEDKNDQRAAGWGPLPMNAVDGRRVNTGMAYVNAHRDRPNLEVRGDTVARRILFAGRRAVGVELRSGGHSYTVRGDEVVLCAGAVKSPHLLALSGIGPRRELEAAGVPVVHPLPGVGKEFADHPNLVLAWTPSPRGDRAAPRHAFESILNFSSSGSPGVSDLEILPVLRPLGALLGDPAASTDLCFLAALQHADSRGDVTLVSGDPDVSPRIEYHYLASAADRRRMRQLVRTTAELVRTAAFRPYIAAFGGLPEEMIGDDRELDRWIRMHLATAVHACGSCTMGHDPDAGAVVDQFGRVHGVAGLRVADTSILPSAPTRGPAATAVMIGERMADLIASSS